MKIISPTELTLDSCSVSEDDSVDGAEWDSATTYAKDAKVRYEHVTYQSTIASNTNKRPDQNWSGEDNAWMKIGATMPYKMLDDYVETQTEGAEGEDLTFTVTFERSDALALLNVEGNSIHVTITDTFDNETIIDEDIYLINDIETLSLYEYYYSPITNTDSYISTQLPMIISGSIEVTIRPKSSVDKASIGHIVIGRKQEIGATKYSSEIGILDYSRKTTDEFGVTSFVKRSYSKNASLILYVPSNRVGKVVNILSSVRAIPVLIAGVDSDVGHDELCIFGWIEDWRTVYEGPNVNEVRVEIQGLI